MAPGSFAGTEYSEYCEQKDQQQNVFTVDLPFRPIIKPWCNTCNQEVETMIVESEQIVCSCHGCTAVIPVKYTKLVSKIRGFECRILVFLKDNHIHFDNDDLWFVDSSGREVQEYNQYWQPDAPTFLPWIRAHADIVMTLCLVFIAIGTFVLIAMRAFE